MEKRTPPNGHTPVRTCVGCGKRRSAVDLHRCVWRDGAIQVDRHGAGRGAWVCGIECLAAARQRRGFDRAWRQSVSPAAIDDFAERWLTIQRSSDKRTQ